MGGTNWATWNGTDIVAYSAYTGGDLGQLPSNSTLNVLPTGAQTAITSAKSFNTLNLTGTEGVAMSGLGSLALLGGGLLGNTSGTISGGVLTGSAGGDLIVITPANLTIASVIVNNGGATGLTKAGSGTLTLTGSNTYSGVTTVGAGTLQVGAGGASGNLGTGPVTDNSALVIKLSSPSTFSGAINGAGSLTQAGPGTLTLAGSNTYSGGTTINAGTIQLGTSASLPSGMAAKVNGTLDIGALDANVGALTGTGTVNHSGSGSNTLSVASGDFGGTIESSGGMLALLKTGSGQLILSGTDTYSGGTTVNAGTLCVTDAGAIANGTNLTIGPGGTFIYNPAAAAAPSGIAGGAAISSSSAPDASSAASQPTSNGVPEPNTLLLLLAGGGGGLLWHVRRRRLLARL